MRNLFIFIRRYSNLLLFLLLQLLAISLLVNFNSSHQAAYLEMSYGITGKINKKANWVKSYFALAENNRKLAEENATLKNGLYSNFVDADSSGRVVIDSVKRDTTGKQRKYFYRTALVVNNSVSQQENFIQLQRGSNEGVQKDMAVTSAGGIVGVVTSVSANYAEVLSLLNRSSHVSVMMKKDHSTGTLEWDGKNPSLLQLNKLPKSTKIAIGDTVLTSNSSFNFPPGLMVGTIAKIDLEQGGNSYMLQIKPGANFFTLQYVDVIENIFYKEQKELESKVRKP
jgi:rod shape-determining protein MreC